MDYDAVHMPQDSSSYEKSEICIVGRRDESRKNASSDPYEHLRRRSNGVSTERLPLLHNQHIPVKFSHLFRQ
jgi:hypothetical protein